ncbi:MAG: glycosyltransferase [Bacteroidota bacterium]|jgi:rhamnosyl/mannosyltransferase
MKIVQTNKGYFPLIGGIETTIANLAEGLIKIYGNEVNVLVCNDKTSFFVKKEKVNGVLVTYVPVLGKIASLPISLTYAFHLKKLRGEVLHIHEPFPLASLAILAFPGILKNFSRIVITWHSDIIRQKWALILYRPLLYKFLRKVDKILVSNQNLINNSPFLRYFKDSCEVIPLGVNLDWVHNAPSRLHQSKKIRQQYGTPLILFVGRLVYYKGISYLIEALNNLQDVHCVIIGDGPLMREIVGTINKYQLSKRIFILPCVKNQDLYAFYEACDMLVLPSVEKSEAYGLVQIEAMASGKPVISTELHTGTSFVNQNGITGLIVPPRDSKSLSEAISKLVHDDALRISLGKNAKERALKEFTAEKMVERTYEVYKKLLLT